MDIKEKILKELEDKTLKAGEIAKNIGEEDKKLFDKAMKELKETGKIISPKRCFYTKNK